MKRTNYSVKSSPRWAGVMAGAALLAAGLQSVTAQTVGVNFVNSSGGGVDNGNADSLLASETAGAPGYAQTNWNNLSKWGSGVTLTNGAGSATALTINWDAGWNSSFGTASLGSDGKLMDGSISGSGNITDYTALSAYDNVYGMPGGAKPMVYVGGLNAWCLAQGAIGYSIVVYQNDGGWWGNDQMWVESVSGSPLNNTMVAGPDLTPHLYNCFSSGFSGTYNRISDNATSTSSKAYGANYGVFNSLTNDAVLIRTGTLDYENGTMCGFQIVPVFPPPWSVATNSVTTNTVGVNFLNAGGSGIDNGEPASLLASETAGAPGYEQAQWNNLAQQGTGSDGSVSLTNSLGVISSLFINWAGAWTGSSGTASGLGTPDGKLMDGFLGGNSSADPVSTNVYSSASAAKPLAYVSGLQAWYQAQGAEGFNVVMYRNNHNYWEGTYAWIQSVTGSPANNTMAGAADLTPRLYNSQNNVFSGTYVQIPNTATNSGSEYYGGGNYCVFPPLTNDAVLIRSASQTGWGDAPMNGFQVVPVFPIMPTAGTPTITPSSTVYGGVPVSIAEAATGDPFHTNLWYQWFSDNATGGAVNNSILNATNATLNVTPTNSPTGYQIQYLVVVTNLFGVSTSSVATLTVLGGVPPSVSQDTTPGAGNGLSPAYAYAGSTMTFSAAFSGLLPITNSWQSNSVTIVGATGTTFALSNLPLSASASYDCTATNVLGGVATTPTPLTVLADLPALTTSSPYAYDVFTNQPVAYWRFAETIDTTANSVQAYDYSGNNNEATYGSAAADNQAGPQYPQFAGFEAANTGVGLQNSVNNSDVIAPSLSLKTNTVTITAWINPSSNIGNYWGLFMWRGTNSDAAGFGFGGNSSSGVAELGYTWNNNNPSTYNYHSALYPPVGQWSFVTLAITPTNSTIYLYYIDQNSGATNLFKAVQASTNLAEAFSGGTTVIGGDNNNANRNFNGTLAEVAVFNKTLSEAQVQNLFLTAIGSPGIAPGVTVSAYPATSVYSGQNVRLNASVTGTVPLTLQWQTSPNGVTWANIPGANSASVLVNPLTVGTVYYQLVASNPAGSGSNSVVVTFNALPATPAGLWTVNFELTNNVTGTGLGLGSYSGRGILGTGGYWNPISDTLGAYGGGSFFSVSDFQDDGATHSGVSCGIYSCGGMSTASAPQADSSDIGNLLDQYVICWYSPNELQVKNLPNGTYNLCCFACNGSYANAGTTFVVHDTQNGDQTNSTLNASPILPLQQNVNFVVFSNVHVSGGMLSVDVEPNSGGGSTEADFNGAQIQLVSYDPVIAGFHGSPTNVFVTQSVIFVNTSSAATNWVWNFGDGNILTTNSNASVSHAYSAVGTYTVSQTATGPGGTASVTDTAYVVVLPKPVIGSATVLGGDLVLSGTNGAAGVQYRVLTSTNVAQPMAGWTPVWTNVFAPDGSYSYTNSSPTNGAGFFILVSP